MLQRVAGKRPSEELLLILLILIIACLFPVGNA
jgi:hypothetical protein